MNILLTGNEGWIGGKIKELLYLLLGSPTSVTEFNCYDNAENYAKWLEGIRTMRLQGVDTIIHCGAVSDSNADGNHLWDMNYRATKTLVKLAKSNNARFIYFSSCAAIDPDTQYGWTKHCAEDYIKTNLPKHKYVILRPYNVWGFDEHDKESPSVIHKIMNGTIKKLYANYTRDFVNVDDIVDAVRIVLEKWWINGTYDLGTTVETKIDELWAEVSIGLLPPLPVVECPVKELRVARINGLEKWGWNPKPISEFMTDIRDETKAIEWKPPDPEISFTQPDPLDFYSEYHESIKK